MKKNHPYRWKAVLSFLMALWVLNLSVDSPDDYMGASSYGAPFGEENLAVNDIESITELVVEQVLEYPDAIPEHDEADEESGLQKLLSDWYFFPVFSLEFIVETELLQKLAVFDPFLYAGFWPDIVPPPPKQVG